jgi:hypothetical protein
MRPAVIRKPMEKAVVGQQEPASSSVGSKSPFLSRMVGTKWTGAYFLRPDKSLA